MASKPHRAHVYWSRTEASALRDFLSRHRLFAGRARTIADLDAAIAATPRGGRMPALFFEHDRATALLAVLADEKRAVLVRATTKLDRAVRAAALRGHPRTANPASDARRRRVHRGDAGQFK